MSDALRKRFRYEHPIFRGRADGMRERQRRVAHLVDEDGRLVVLASEFDAGEQQRIIDPCVDRVAEVAPVRLERPVSEPQRAAGDGVGLRTAQPDRRVESKGVLFVGDALCTRDPVTGRVGAQVIPSALNVSTDQCFDSLDAIARTQAQVPLPGHGEAWRDGAAAAVESARRLGRS